MELKKINDHTWQIERSGQMKVPAIIYSSDKLIGNVKGDKTLEQVKNVACLPGIQRASYAMPDAHQGYGFSIGGVAAFNKEEGIVSPGGVGYDINCGVRLLKTDFTLEDIEPRKKILLEALFGEVPAGVGKKGKTRVSADILSEVMEKGGQWAIDEGYGTKDDLQKTEEYGRMKGADPQKISERAFKRGMPQLGTLGSGNHFVEMQKVDKIYDEDIAKKFGIGREGQIMLMIHSGSRGLGHQVASDYIRKMEGKFGFSGLPDRELINAPCSAEYLTFKVSNAV